MQTGRPLRIAITGASGFLGSSLCQVLADSGHAMIALVRDAARATSQHACLWEPQNGILQLEKCENLDAVVHLAGRSIGQHRWTNREKRFLRDSRVTATEILSEQLGQLRCPPAAFICASATGIYGDCGDQVVTEDMANGKGFLAQLARDWEKACAPLVKAGTRVVNARLGMVLAPHGGVLQKMCPVFRLGLGGVLGSGTQYWSWITFNDAVNAICALLFNPECRGPYNLTSPEPVSNRQFTRELAHSLRRPALLTVPRWALRMVMGEMANALLLASCRASSQRLIESGFSFSDANLQRYLWATYRG